MPKKPTHADAELILKLYDLRREAEMRKARQWWAMKFWPDNVEDFMKVTTAMGTPENNWLRQVLGYWDIAASLVVHGTLSEKLFLEPSFSGELFIIYAKLLPFLKELREKMQSPYFLLNAEKVFNGSKTGRDRLKYFEQRVAARRRVMKEAAEKAG